MLLNDINFRNTIVENDYGYKLYFKYKKNRNGRELLSSPNPIILYLGTWDMIDKKGNHKKFVCGINLAYLNKEELIDIQKILPDILKHKSTRLRYRKGRLLLPDIFEKAYRTYNINRIIGTPVRGRFYALKFNKKDEEEARELAAQDNVNFDKLSYRKKNQYIDKVLQKRGEEELSLKQKAKEFKKIIDKPEDISKIKEPPEEKEKIAKAFQGERPEPKVKPDTTKFKRIDNVINTPDSVIQSPIDASSMNIPNIDNVNIKQADATGDADEEEEQK